MKTYHERVLPHLDGTPLTPDEQKKIHRCSVLKVPARQCAEEILARRTSLKPRMSKEDIARRNAKAARTAAAYVAKVQAMLDLPAVGTVEMTPKGMPHVVFFSNARIVLLTRRNPYKEGCGRWQRFETLRTSRTVGEFLALMPEWHATITRNVMEGHITVKRGGLRQSNTIQVKR
jgi:hypothetical protein